MLIIYIYMYILTKYSKKNLIIDYLKCVCEYVIVNWFILLS